LIALHARALVSSASSIGSPVSIQRPPVPRLAPRRIHFDGVDDETLLERVEAEPAVGAETEEFPVLFNRS
jgi:hypothetical protein